MIVVELKDGRSVEVETGVKVSPSGGWLLIINSEGKELAGFDFDGVLFFHLEEEPKDDS